MQKNPYTRTVAIGLFFFTSLVTLAADLLSKMVYFDRFLLDSLPRFSWFGGRVQHYLHANLGATFNAPIPLPLIIVAAVVFCGWLVSFVFTNSSHWKHPVLLLGGGLVFGGALGNLYDRVALGFVRDWMLFWHRTVANIADFAILIGFILLLGLSLRIPSRQPSRSMPRSKA
jgi:signal peptidase II